MRNRRAKTARRRARSTSRTLGELLYERETEIRQPRPERGHGRDRRRHPRAVIALNVVLILRLSRAQSDELGNTQLDVIRSDLEDTITEAETDVLRVAMGAEQLM